MHYFFIPLQLQKYELKFRTNISIAVYLSLLLLLLLLLHVVPSHQAFPNGDREGALAIGTILCHKEAQTDHAAALK